MSNETKKVMDLVRFYYIEQSPIQLIYDSKIKICGTIKKITKFSLRHFIILETLNKSNMKIFFDDIKPNSIIPYDIETTESYQRNSIPTSVRKNLWKNYFGDNFTGVCNVCRKEININDFEAGHIISFANGGSDNIDNLVPLCRDCNRSMGKQNLDEFKKEYYN